MYNIQPQRVCIYEYIKELILYDRGTYFVISVIPSSLQLCHGSLSYDYTQINSNVGGHKNILS